MENKTCPKCHKPMFCIGGLSDDSTRLPVACRCRNPNCGYKEDNFDEVEEKEKELKRIKENRKEYERRTGEMLP